MRAKTKRPDGQPRKRRARPRFLAVDFFCGAGGTTRGLIDAGGYVIAGIDKDERCERTYVDNNSNRTLDSEPARFLPFDIFPRCDWHPEGQQTELFSKLDSLIAKYRRQSKGLPLLFAICAPCQPFTKLSKKELTPERRYERSRDKNLLAEACKFIRRFKPDLVLSENVASIDDGRYGGVWNTFRCTLEELGYSTGTDVICTSRFGIPQRRKRSILLAAKKRAVRKDRLCGLFGADILVPTYDEEARTVSVAEVLHHLPPIKAGQIHPTVPNHRARTLSPLNIKRIASAKPGQSNEYMAQTKFGDLSLKCHREVNKRQRVRCFTDVYTRMAPDRPSPTITTKCHSISNGRFGHYDVKQNRGISLREAAILQSFPDDYIFYPENQIEPVARMIGNAVPPKLAEYFAGYLLRCIALPAQRT